MKQNYVKEFLEANNLELSDKISVTKNDGVKESYQIAVIRTNEDDVRYLLIDEAGVANDKILCELMSRWWKFTKLDNKARDFQMGKGN